MFAPINPEGERIRAQAIIRSLTDQQEAAKVFGEIKTNRRNNGQFIMRVFKAIQLNRRPVVADEPVQQPVYSPRPVTTSGCS